MQGTQEGLYHGVPILFLPFANDHFSIANFVQREGAGLRIDWNDFTEEKLYNAIQRILTEPRFSVLFS